VAQADNVFTITPSTTEAHAGTFSITFSVTDGATGAVCVVSAFTLAFGDDPGRASFYKGSPTYSNGWISSYNWTVPAGVTSICVLCIGAGGGGGGSNDTSRGGGGGGLAWKNHIPVTAGEIWKVNVGTAGWKDGGQSGDAYPLNATHTYFSTSSNIVILRANGGSTNSTALTIQVDMDTIGHLQHMELVLLPSIAAGLAPDRLTASGVVAVALLDPLVPVVAVGTVLDHTPMAWRDLVAAVAVQVPARLP
jgi:hypothetical protein